MSELGTLLVADDDAPFLRVVVGCLTKAGYHCDEASDAHEAIKLLASREYDLLVSDLEMPGNQNMHLIRELPQIVAGLPVILMTGHPTMESAIQSVQLPVTAYLVKPFKTEELLEQVGRAVEHHQAYRAVQQSHRRIEELNAAFELVENRLKGARAGSAAPWESLMDLTMRNISASLVDVRMYADMMARHKQQQAAGTEPEPNSQPLLLINALREAIAVIEKTRSSFKSKDLADLRRKLESLLQGGTEASRPVQKPPLEPTRS